MKHVFPSRELAHIWAHAGQQSGRRSDSYMSFEGAALKSYATVIARRMPNKKGAVAYLVDHARFSSSTSKHQLHVTRAIPEGAVVFIADSGHRGQSLNWTPGQLRDHYLNKYRTSTSRSTSRYSHIRAQDVKWRLGNLSEAIRVCQFFGLGHKALDKELARAEVKLSEDNEVLRVAKIKSDRRQTQRKAKELADRVTRAITRAEEIVKTGDLSLGERINASALYLLDSRPDLKTAIEDMIKSRDAAAMDAWRTNVPNARASDSWLICLRVNDSDMETSKGAKVPLPDAKRAYQFACKVRAKGWHKNGEQFAIGMYHLDAVNEQGIVAGCHRVSWEEIDRFAALMGWTVPQSD